MVTIPTIDQISGSTVMRKMRDLINHFITFAGEVDDELTTLDTKFDGYYTKVEIDADFPTFDYLSANYYNKGETDSLVADITKYINALKPLNVWESSQTTGDWRISLLYTEKFKLLSNGTLDINTDGTTIKENSLTHQLYVDSQALAGDGLSGGVSPNVLDVKVDGTSIGINASGELESLIEGATYTAGDGISINANNEISLSNGWELVDLTGTNYFNYIKDNISNYDFLVLLPRGNDWDINYAFITMIYNSSYTGNRIITPLYSFYNGGDTPYRFASLSAGVVSVYELSSIGYALSANNISVKDEDGNAITSANITTYISNNVVIKDFYLDINDPKLNKHTYTKVFKNSAGVNIIYGGSVFQVDIGYIVNLITGSSSSNTYMGASCKLIANNNFASFYVKLYKRKK